MPRKFFSLLENWLPCCEQPLMNTRLRRKEVRVTIFSIVFISSVKVGIRSY